MVNAFIFLVRYHVELSIHHIGFSSYLEYFRNKLSKFNVNTPCLMVCS
jgi:hypothetical protein